MDNSFKSWQENPTPDNFKQVMTKIKPIINSSLSLYVGNEDTAAKSKARVLASRALKSYDPTKGTKLKTHIMTQLQPLRRFATSARMITHIPEDAYRGKKVVDDFTKEYLDTYDRDPSDAEISDGTGLSIKRLKDLRTREQASSEGSFGDYTPVASSNSWEDEWADYVYYDLNNINRKIFEWRTGYNGNKMLSNNEVAKKLKLSPAAISQRVAAITARLREGSKYAD